MFLFSFFLSFLFSLQVLRVGPAPLRSEKGIMFVILRMIIISCVPKYNGSIRYNLIFYLEILLFIIILDDV